MIITYKIEENHFLASGYYYITGKQIGVDIVQINSFFGLTICGILFILTYIFFIFLNLFIINNYNILRLKIIKSSLDLCFSMNILSLIMFMIIPFYQVNNYKENAITTLTIDINISYGIGIYFGILTLVILIIITFIDRQFISIFDMIFIINNESILGREIDINDLIFAGEGSLIEFKSSLRWDFKQNKINKELELEVVKNICGFANKKGGYIFIGVKNDGSILGLEYDYKTLGNKKNKDGFLLYLDNIIQNLLGDEIHALLDIQIKNEEDKEICLIRINKSQNPIYIENRDFYIRRGSSTKKLNPKEAIEYVKSHFF